MIGPRIDLLNFETGIDTAITKQLSLRVVFQGHLYASQPAAGQEEQRPAPAGRRRLEVLTVV